LTPTRDRPGVTSNPDARNTQQFIAGGDYVFASDELVEDLTHNFFLGWCAAGCIRWLVFPYPRIPMDTIPG
jgi:hypothetical protein